MLVDNINQEQLKYFKLALVQCHHVVDKFKTCWLQRFGQTTSQHTYTHRVLLSKDKKKPKKQKVTGRDRDISL